MIRLWIGVALLAVSWMLGQNYYVPPNYPAWVVVVALGVVCFAGIGDRRLARRDAWLALVMLLPAVWFAPWPLRAAPLLIVVGLAVKLLPIPARWPRSLGRGALAAGVVMLAQALGMACYTAATARSHELPRPLPDVLAGVASLLGIDAAADGSTLVMHSIRQVHRLGATWDLLLDPATFCFLVGSLAMLALLVRARASGAMPWQAWLCSAGILAAVVVVWLPVRAGVLMALYLHRAARFDTELPLHVMNQFLSPWVLLLMLAGPVLLAWRLVRVRVADAAEEPAVASEGETAGKASHRHSHRRAEGDSPIFVLRKLGQSPATLLVLLAVAVLTAAVHWDPVGARQGGRVMVVERHSTWEPTTRPYDTKWFGHDSSYNYAAVYDYCGQYFEMSRLLPSERIDTQTLKRCDVLVIKIPTARYAPEEVEAVVEFVENGGGLLLVGDHTNVFKSGTYLNDVARHFGFTFRHDLLFGTGDSPYAQLYRTPRVPHPAVQHLPPMDFAVGCSIDPGRSWGRTAIRDAGLFSMPADYHPDNYHPVPQLVPEMRYGPFIQLWATRYGNGRVLAFADSTIFSNFCTFQPGKAELLTGMLEWLNHRNAIGDSGPWLLLLGVLLLAAGLWLACKTAEGDSPIFAAQKSGQSPGSWIVLLAAGMFGWVAASVAIGAIARRAMPVPKAVRPITRVVIDRTTSNVPLSKGPNAEGDGKGYGLFEQWIPRLGCYTTRLSGPEVFSGDVLAVLSPSRSVGRPFREQLVAYVERGGKLLVIDSPENTASTANSLLWPFGLSVLHGPEDQREPVGPGPLMLTEDWPGLEVSSACEVSGGDPVAYLGTTPVGAVARCKQGTVMALGFGAAFQDAQMSVWNMHPPAEMLFESHTYLRYNLQFALLKSLISGEPPAAFYSGHVVFDRTLSEVPLPDEVAAPVEDESFAIFERWPGSYLGYSTARAGDAEAFSGDLLVVVYPSRPPGEEFRDGLVRYVAAGGRMLLVDAPDNAGSTANELLKPFGLSVDHDAVQQGRLIVERREGDRSWPDTPIDPAYRVRGGEPFAWMDGTPVGVTTRHGQGAVTAVAFGSIFTNTSMLRSWNPPPPARHLVPYDLETALIRSLMTDRPFARSVPNVAD